MNSDQKYSKEARRRYRRLKGTVVLLVLLLIGSQSISMGLLMVCEREPLEQVRRELLGLEYLGPLYRLQKILPAYPGSRAAAAGGGESAREAFLLYEQEVQGLFDHLEKIDRRYGARLDTTEDLVQLLSLWSRLRKAGDQPEERARLHQQLSDKVRAMTGLVGDTSGLILDPEIQTYYPIESLVNQFGQGLELLTVAAALPERQAGDRELRAALLAWELQRHLQETSRSFSVAFDKEPSLRSRLERPLRIYESRLTSLIGLLDRSARPGEEIAAGLSSSARSALSANSGLFAGTLPQVEELLEARRQRLEGRRMLRAAYVAPFLLIGFALALWGIRSAVVPARRPEADAETGPRPADPSAGGLAKENELLKLLVAELCLANRSLRLQVQKPSP